MRGNFFQYHVQDRMYDKAEVLSLINDEQYKHHLLSGGAHFYSLGSSAEVVGAVFGYAEVGAAIVTSLVVGAALLSGLAKNDNNKITVNNTTFINNGTIVNITTAIEDKMDSQYSGREVAAFLNKYYDYSYAFNFHAKVAYDKILNQFLEHKYADADVPTLDHSSMFDVAVLDVHDCFMLYGDCAD